MKPFATRLRESEIEEDLVAGVEKRGGRAYKFTSPSRRGVPDRLVLMPIVDPEHRKIVAEYVRFVECKACGEVPTVNQLREHARLARLGHIVDVTDSLSSNERVLLTLL